jgi:putative SOS response-associated peptidase YedK
MCGRFDQNDIARRYVAAFGWADAAYRGQAEPTHNATPGTARLIFHQHGGQPLAEDVYWGYRPSWAVGKLPVAYQARLEKIHGNYWRRLLQSGRAVVPAHGWYEWTGEKGKRQAWHIHRKDHAPLFMLALASFGPARDHPCEAGFVLLTTDSQGGMVDVHDRSPLVLDAADAATWLDPDLSPEQAAELARALALGPECFAWHQATLAPARPAANAVAARTPEPVAQAAPQLPLPL